MIASPDAGETRSRLADWIELQAMVSSHGAGQSDIKRLARLESDAPRERDAEGLEEEILESSVEELLDRIAQEIDFRAQALGTEYAFEVHRPFRIILKPAADLTTSHWTYLFLLLLTGETAHALPKSDELSKLIGSGRTLFHACASIGVAGILRNAETVWFGWPRPHADVAKFSAALQDLCRKMGWGAPKDPPPPGLPSNPKDDGIDIVGWRRYRDRRNGTMVVLCQAATGNNWDEKSVLTHVGAFRQWFATEIYSHAMGAIALPFPAHHELGEYPESGYESARLNYMHRKEAQHGVLIDRLRIVEAVHDVSQGGATDVIGGYDKIPELKIWVEQVLAAMTKPH